MSFDALPKSFRIWLRIFSAISCTQQVLSLSKIGNLFKQEALRATARLRCHVFAKEVDKLSILSHKVVDNGMINQVILSMPVFYSKKSWQESMTFYLRVSQLQS